MERTKEQWQAIGRVLAHGIHPGCWVEDFEGVCGSVPDVSEWVNNDPCVDFWPSGSRGQGNLCRLLELGGGFATVIDPPQPLSGKEVSVTIDGQTYTAIIK